MRDQGAAPFMTRYVALLRGINVGGKNLIRMPALKACFAEQGFADAATYIQSGNVIFGAPGGRRAELVRRIEEMLGDAFGYRASVVLRSDKELRAIVARAPAGFGTQPDRYRYDVIFLKEPLTAAAALARIGVKDGVDRVSAGRGALYFTRLAARAAESRLSRLAGDPIYQRVTVRNWNTTTALVRLLDGAPGV
jgi:uncharacterized protein (DUF1697 family)